MYIVIRLISLTELYADLGSVFHNHGLQIELAQLLLTTFGPLTRLFRHKALDQASLANIVLAKTENFEGELGSGIFLRI